MARPSAERTEQTGTSIRFTFVLRAINRGNFPSTHLKTAQHKKSKLKHHYVGFLFFFILMAHGHAKVR